VVQICSFLRSTNGSGFVSYDIFAINIAAQMLGYVYGHGHVLNINQDLGVKVATPIGNLFGQLLFGWLADVLGRKRMCMSQDLICLVSFSSVTFRWG
jgi:MFS transporter, PHS family, inorganic phosphate transporter